MARNDGGRLGREKSWAPLSRIPSRDAAISAGYDQALPRISSCSVRQPSRNAHIQTICVPNGHPAGLTASPRELLAWILIRRFQRPSFFPTQCGGARVSGEISRVA